MQRRRRDDCPTKWRVCKGRNLQLSENLSSAEVLELDDQNQKNPEQSLEAFDVLKQDSQQSLMTCTTHNFAILQHLQYLHYNSFGKRKKKKNTNSKPGKSHCTLKLSDVRTCYITWRSSEWPNSMPFQVCSYPAMHFRRQARCNAWDSWMFNTGNSLQQRNAGEKKIKMQEMYITGGKRDI